MALETLFDQVAQSRVAAAVAAAEERSQGQIVPVVVARSDPFSEARHRGAVAAVLLVTSLILLLLPQLHLWELALAQVATWVIGWTLSGWPPLERVLVGRRLLTEASRARAVRAFHEHGLHRTPEGTGVLVFASLFEHAVVILGDRGIDARMGAEGWRGAVDVLVRSIRAGRPSDGFVEAIVQCGEVLAQYFPRTDAPVPNSLDDRLRIDKAD